MSRHGECEKCAILKSNTQPGWAAKSCSQRHAATYQQAALIIGIFRREQDWASEAHMLTLNPFKAPSLLPCINAMLDKQNSPNPRSLAAGRGVYNSKVWQGKCWLSTIYLNKIEGELQADRTAWSKALSLGRFGRLVAEVGRHISQLNLKWLEALNGLYQVWFGVRPPCQKPCLPMHPSRSYQMAAHLNAEQQQT